MLKLRSMSFKGQGCGILLSQELTICLHDPGGNEVEQGNRTEAVNRPHSLSDNLMALRVIEWVNFMFFRVSGA